MRRTTTATTIPVCRGCAHVRLVEAKGEEPEHCGHELAADVVTGRPTPCRAQRGPSGACGPEGAHFEGNGADEVWLSDDPKKALLQIAAFLDGVDTKGRHYPPDKDKRGCLGWWQPVEFFYALQGYSYEARRVAAIP